jgi:hypothetical protein
MKSQRWLYALLGLLIGVVLGRRLAQYREPKPVQSRRAPTAKPDGNRKLTREDVLRMIEENGGPEELHLSGYDLSGIDLSTRTVVETVKASDWSAQEDPTRWLSVRTEGLNLRGVNARLRGASLCDVDLSDAYLVQADLHRADLRRAFLWRANLEETNLYMASMSDAELTGANLRAANIYRAKLSGATVERESLGGYILQEKKRLLERNLEIHYPGAHFNKQVVARRFVAAKGVYRSLKICFMAGGQYDDASWAHVKERQLGRKTHWPPSRARACYAEELEGLVASGPRRHWKLLRFYIRHLRSYISDWIVELTCGYGEKPLRTLWWALAVVLILPIFYWLSGGIVSADGTPLTWLDYLNYSFGAFTTIGFARFITANWIAETLTSLEALLGISVLALLMFALGNRISRS